MAGKRNNSDNSSAPRAVKTITVRGVRLKIDPTRLDSIDFLYRLRDAQNAGEDGDIFGFLDIIDDLLGVEQREKFVDALRDETGRATTEAFAKGIEEVFEAIPKS